jgi:hypothetical protein
VGYLNTDWGDDGHLNALSYSYWGFAYGADCAWRAEPDAAAEARFDQRFLAVVLPGAPERWIELTNRIGNLYRLMQPAPGRLQKGLRLLLTGEYRRAADGHPQVGWLIEHFSDLPRAEDLMQAEAVAHEAIGALAPSAMPLLPALDLVRREWLAGMLLASFAFRRALNFQAAPKRVMDSREDYLIEGTRLLDETWMARNKTSDWPEQARRLRALIGNSG